MSYQTALREDAQKRIEEIGQADILVGIPSYNNANTIGHVVRMAAEGMVKHFPDLKPVLINSDGGSPDGTRQVVLNTPVPQGVEVIATEYQGMPGKGSAFRAVFEAAKALGVKVCVVVDSDLRSITPEWIELLAGPIVKEGYGYVTPFYIRHKYDGTITNNICYPMTRMLYGLDIRQPIGGDFGFSGELLDHYLGQDVWETDVARFGIDIWMTTTAINAGARISQTNLGAKIHDAKDPAAALGPMFRQVVGTLFGMMAKYEAHWKAVTGSQPTPIYGKPKELEPEPVPVTLSAMIEKLRAGREEWGKVWDGVLSAENRATMKAILAQPDDAYQFTAQQWAPIVFDFAVAYNKSDLALWNKSYSNSDSAEEAYSTGLDKDAVIDSMTPLYYGRTAGLVVESQDMDSATFEREVIQAQARTFGELKPRLIERWDSP
ncbi:MAG: glycosyltransferase [Anaerolineales bacterium]|nr:glycosyltransferase [Anaerolineales bacterium]